MNGQAAEPISSTPLNKFGEQFTSSLLRDGHSVQVRNYDRLRYGGGWKDRIRVRLKDILAEACARIHLVPSGYDAAWLGFIIEHLDAFNESFSMLQDTYSRELMVKIMEFRVLGPRHVKLPLNTDDFWRKYDSVDQEYARKLRTQTVWNKRWSFNRYEVPAGSDTVVLDAYPLTIIDTFLLEQYAYKRAQKPIAVRQGDVVIDGGGCYGDTALYFAAKAGTSGAVVTFEFMEENLAILRKNLAANPKLMKRVRIIDKAIWSRSGDKLSFKTDGPGTRIATPVSGKLFAEVETASIDDIVKSEKLPRVDFIKMDIEGAELEGLKGAIETIRQFKPNLAISLYHKKEDFITIPQWIQSLGLGYRFYLDHFTIHGEETVLFATARN